jgi:hypothetical protein
MTSLFSNGEGPLLWLYLFIYYLSDKIIQRGSTNLASYKVFPNVYILIKLKFMLRALLI